MSGMLDTCPHPTGSLTKPLPKTLRPMTMPSGGRTISGMNAWAAGVTASNFAFHILEHDEGMMQQGRVQTFFV